MRISISKHIYKTLSENPELKKRIGMKIYPIATKSEVKFPFIVYERESVTTTYDKGGPAMADVDVAIYVLSDDYTESLEIAELVISALDMKQAEYEGYDVLNARINNVPESYVNQTFVQQINIQFTIKEN